MNDPARARYPYGRTREEDLAMLADGRETGWWDDTGRPAPWPEDFLDPYAGWVPDTHHDSPENPENPPF